MKVYFITDAHLGSLAFPDRRERERKLVDMLDMMGRDADAIYMLGDMFDFWHEWKRVVPKGFTRFLGKLSELTDRGIEIHYFTGNHDVWAYDYLHDECGVILHSKPEKIYLPIDGEKDEKKETFYIAHGDGLGDPNKSFKCINAIFHSRLCQWLFKNLLHPDWAMAFGMEWARRSRIKHEGLGQEQEDELGRPIPDKNSYMGEEKEHLVIYTKQLMNLHPDIHYYIYGHRHIELDLMLSRDVRMLILGETYHEFTYALWDGTTLSMHNV